MLDKVFAPFKRIAGVIPEAPAPSGPGDPPAPKHTEGPAVPGGDQTAPAHVEPAMPEKTEGPIKPEQSVIPGMGEDTPAPSSKVINLSDIQAADKGGKDLLSKRMSAEVH